MNEIGFRYLSIMITRIREEFNLPRFLTEKGGVSKLIKLISCESNASIEG